MKLLPVVEIQHFTPGSGWVTRGSEPITGHTPHGNLKTMRHETYDKHSGVGRIDHRCRIAPGEMEALREHFRQ